MNKRKDWVKGVNLTLVQLQTLVRLAEVGNFTRVAEELHLTQPAVTQQIRTLERQLGVRLVDVAGRRPFLTEGGRFLAERAREILANEAALEREMREFALAQAGELRVGATLTIGSYSLPSILARFRERHPGVTIQVEIANTETMVRLVSQGALSLALIEGPLTDERFDVEVFQEDHLVLAVPPDHPFAAAPAVSVSELAGQPFIWREAGSGTRAAVKELLQAHGVAVRSVVELPSSEGAARAVEAGLGVSILSRLIVQDAVARGAIKALSLDDADLTRTFRVITLRGRTLSPAARAFMSLLTVRQHSGTTAPMPLLSQTGHPA